MQRRSALRVVLAAGLAGLAGAPDAWAHHAFAAEYDAERPIDLTGVVTELRWTNPHSWLYLDARRRGTVTNWEIEFGAPNVLEDRGLKKADLQPGSQVQLRGYRSKNRGPQAYGVTVRLSDGRVFRTGGVDCPEAGNGGQALSLPGR
jgi:uncharacterized protein DUF6152